MSGPKVVRVVTREELVATCNALLAQLDGAIEAWTGTAERLGQSRPAELATIQTRRAELRELFHNDAFLELQKRVPQETEFIKHSQEQLLESAAAALTLARERATRRRENATTLLAELEKKAPGKHRGTCDALREISLNASPADDSEAVLARAFLLLSSSEPERQLTQAQRELASRLAPVEDTQAYEQWQTLREAPTDKRLSDLNQRLGRLEAERGGQAVAAFTQRSLALETEAESPTRSMKLDALVLDVAAALKTAKDQRVLVGKVHDLLAEFDTLDAVDALPGETASLRRALAANEFSALPSLLDACAMGLQEARKKQTARARREAILNGLATLGYEVREGMATSWAEQGRVILRKPSLDGYGIELAGAPDAQRTQLRAVAFSADRDKTRDRDAETLWCGDVSKLEELVRTQNGSLVIEKALPIGQVPLKVIDVTESEVRESPGAQLIRTK